MPVRRTRASRDWSALLGRLRRWRKHARRALKRLKAAHPAARAGVIATSVLALFPVANVAYHVACKPSEMLFPISAAFDKTPAQTWQDYAPLFHEYSTASVTPELLAALAQAESGGNPFARTYWRWRLAWNPFAILAPASSAVGMYQMTDAAFAQARNYCIRDHLVVADGCGSSGLYFRILPRHAVQLTSVLLERGVAAILAHRHDAVMSPQHRQDLATIIHLCGAGPAKAFAHRGFRLAPGERCSDHDPAAYLAEINGLKRQFRRLAAAQ